MVKEFQYDPDNFHYTDEMKEAYETDGYFIVKGMVPPKEMDMVKQNLVGQEGIINASYDIDDGSGGKSRFCIWSHPGSDVSGMLARSKKCAGIAASMLGGEIYHYHTKLIQKDAYTGGTFQWHQDYGYWYNNGNLFPDLMTISIAIDRADRENGCLEVLRGSHKCGRVKHNFLGGQQGADLERVAQIEKRLPKEYVVLDPGDALYFHCNILHRSNQNNSSRRRWALLFSYNTKANDPCYEHHHPQYTPLDTVEDTEVLTCTNFDDYSGKEFMDPKIDKTVGKPTFVKEPETPEENK